MTRYRTNKKYPGYRVGDDGSVWTCIVTKGKGRGKGRGVVRTYGDKWKRMSPGNRNGYWFVTFYTDAGKEKHSVHRLVLEAFVGPCPEGMECRHYPDPDTSNNRLDNLMWISHVANIADKMIHGTRQTGERHGMAVLTNKKVARIRRLRKQDPEKYNFRVLATMFGVSKSSIFRAIKEHTWKT